MSMNNYDADPIEVTKARWEEIVKRSQERMKSEKKFQCAGITSNHERCSRMVTTIYCEQHSKMGDPQANGLK